MGKTTLVIDDKLMREALKATKLKTKRAAVETGLRELIRKKNIESFVKELGTFDLNLTSKKLKYLRNE